VNGEVVVTINGTVLRLLSGSDIRVTGAGRVEVVNAVDMTIVQGTQMTTVTGPKVIYAPTIIHLSSNHVANVPGTFTLNATATVVNTPTQTTNAQDTRWWLHAVKEGIGHQALCVVAAADSYGNKIQLTVRNTLLHAGSFVNISGGNWVQALSRQESGGYEFRLRKLTLTGAASQTTKSGLDVEK